MKQATVTPTAMSRLRLASLLTLLAITGCAVGPDYTRPALPEGNAYPTSATTSPAASSGVGQTPAQTLVTGMDIPAQWWAVFHSQEIQDLVSEALRNSPTLDAARAALRAARETTRAQVGAYFPTVNASVEPSRQRIATTLASPASSGDN